MKLLPLACFVLGLTACGPGSEVCPTSWTADARAAGGCAPPASYVTQTTSALGSGVYGFVRTGAPDGHKLVVGAAVFALPAGSTTCDAASVNAVATATTDGDGVFSMKLDPGDYRVTSGAVPACTLVHVAAGVLAGVPLTNP